MNALEILNCQEEDKQRVRKHIVSLMELTEEDLKQKLDLLANNGLITFDSAKTFVDPKYFSVLAQDYDYLKNKIEEYKLLGDLDALKEDLGRINSKEAPYRIAHMAKNGEGYKTPDGKYSKLMFSRRLFIQKYPEVDVTLYKDIFANELANKDSVVEEQNVPIVEAPIVETAEVVTTDVTEPVVEKNEVISQEISADKYDYTNDAFTSALNFIKNGSNEAQKVSDSQTVLSENVPSEPSIEPTAELLTSESQELSTDRYDYANESFASALDFMQNGQNHMEENQTDQTRLVEKPLSEPSIEQDTEPLAEKNQKIESNARDYTADAYASTIKSELEAQNDTLIQEPVAEDDELVVSEVEINKPDTPSYANTNLNYQTISASLAANQVLNPISYDTDAMYEEIQTTINPEDVASFEANPVLPGPYDEILTSNQTIALDDEGFDKYERLVKGIERVLISVYGINEVSDSIINNLIKMITNKVSNEQDILYYSITFGKSISEEEKQKLHDAIEEELEYTDIFRLSSDNIELGRAA